MISVRDIPKLNVKGFLDEEEGMRLYELAREAGRRGPMLEIGGYCGKSTLYLGLGCKDAGAALFSIDHHRGSEEQQPGEEYFDPELFDEREGKIDTFRFLRRTIEAAELDTTVIPIVATSHIVARPWATPLSLVFIDGGHTYFAAFSDYTAWMPHLMPEGYLAVHDIFTDASKGGQAPYFVYKLALASGLFDELPMVKTLGVLKRLQTGHVPARISEMKDW